MPLGEEGRLMSKQEGRRSFTALLIVAGLGGRRSLAGEMRPLPLTFYCVYFILIHVARVCWNWQTTET